MVLVGDRAAADARARRPTRSGRRCCPASSSPASASALVNPPLASTAVGVVPPAARRDGLGHQLDLPPGRHRDRHRRRSARSSSTSWLSNATGSLARVPAEVLAPGRARLCPGRRPTQAYLHTLHRRAERHPARRGDRRLRGRRALVALIRAQRLRRVAGRGAAAARGRARADGAPARWTLAAAAANVFDALLRGGLADLRRTPARIIDEGPKRTVYRYLAATRTARSTRCRCCSCRRWPRRRRASTCAAAARWPSTCSRAGHPTYLVEYGDIAFSDRDLGLEHWVDDIIPTAIAPRQRGRRRRARCSSSAGAWAGSCRCWRSPATTTLPVDVGRAGRQPVRLHARCGSMAPMRPLANVTDGLLGTRDLPRCSAARRRRSSSARFQLTSIDKYLTKPLVACSRTSTTASSWPRSRRSTASSTNMHAYPGRTMGQLYHRFFRVNELADGRLDARPTRRSTSRTCACRCCRSPGASDVLAPRAGRPPRRGAAAQRAATCGSRPRPAATSAC